MWGWSGGQDVVWSVIEQYGITPEEIYGIDDPIADKIMEERWYFFPKVWMIIDGDFIDSARLRSNKGRNQFKEKIEYFSDWSKSYKDNLSNPKWEDYFDRTLEEIVDVNFSDNTIKLDSKVEDVVEGLKKLDTSNPDLVLSPVVKKIVDSLVGQGDGAEVWEKPEIVELDLDGFNEMMEEMKQEDRLIKSWFLKKRVKK